MFGPASKKTKSAFVAFAKLSTNLLSAVVHRYPRRFLLRHKFQHSARLFSYSERRMSPAATKRPSRILTGVISANVPLPSDTGLIAVHNVFPLAPSDSSSI